MVKIKSLSKLRQTNRQRLFCNSNYFAERKHGRSQTQHNTMLGESKAFVKTAHSEFLDIKKKTIYVERL